MYKWGGGAVIGVVGQRAHPWVSEGLRVEDRVSNIDYLAQDRGCELVYSSKTKRKKRDF